MSAAFLWGLLGGSSLVLGGVIALRFAISQRLLGLIMAFGAGVLISAVAYELVEEAFNTSAGSGGVGLGLFAGAGVFYGGDYLIDRIGGAERKSSAGEQAAGSALSIVLGIILDGIPESIVLGSTVLEAGTVSVAFLAAVFLSNLPEAIAATTRTRRVGLARRPHPRSVDRWWRSSAAWRRSSGTPLFDGADPSTVAFVLAFAGGAILTMLADTMMPEAFEHGGKLVGLATTSGSRSPSS